MNEQLEAMQRRYQSVFSGKDGAIVLADILNMLGFFGNNPANIVPANIAVANTIISRLNIYSAEGTVNYVEKILQAAQPPIGEEGDEYDPWSI